MNYPYEARAITALRWKGFYPYFTLLFTFLFPLFFTSLSFGQLNKEANASGEAKKKLFYLSFDQGFNVADGQSPLNSENLPELTDGLIGKGALFSNGQFLNYVAGGKLNPSKGSISLWVKNPSENNSATTFNGRRYLFSVDGKDVTSGLLSAGILPDFGTFLETGKDQNRNNVIYSLPVYTLEKVNKWHQITYTWDYTRGIKIFVNGSLVLNKLTPKLPVPNQEAFFVGGTPTSKQHLPLVLDEFSIFNYELNEQEVWDYYIKSGGTVQTETTLLDPFKEVGDKQSVPVLFVNRDHKPVSITSGEFLVSTTQNAKLQAGKINNMSLAAQSRSTVNLPIGPITKPGNYLLTVKYKDNGRSVAHSDTIVVLEPYKPNDATTSKVEAIQSIDLASVAPLTESVKTSVVHSELGNYREAGSMKNDRFVVSFSIKDVGALHEAIIRYPDDKTRAMEIVLQDMNGFRDYQAQTGVLTGNEYGLSGKMKELRFLFWPRSEQQSIIFMTELNGQPAAVKDIQINRLNQLTPLAVNAVSNEKTPGREIGLYYEDPVIHRNFGTGSDLKGFSDASTKLLDYMGSFGQNTLHYPVVWYGGPLYGTEAERYEPDLYSGQGGQRPHPHGYVRYLLKRLHQRGMKFNAGLHIHTLQSLEDIAITDRTKIDAGQETVLNVKGNGEVWYGKFHGSDPSYNPLDKRVQGAVKTIVREIGQRYGQEPAFTGVTLTIARVKLFGFGSIESGYNDVNLNDFQRESGITIPVYKPGKESRYSDSYKWLMNNAQAREAWIDWRCKKMHDHYKDLADELARFGKDIKLTLSVFVGFAIYNQLSHYLDESALDALRESGMDPRLYTQDSNIVLGFTQVPADLRWRLSQNYKAVNIESTRTVFLAPEVIKAFAAKQQTEVTIHDRYWEDPIGKTKPLAGLVGKNGIGELTWRVSTLNATDFHSLESYVAALNNSDALRITKGGFLIGTYGMEDHLAEFSKAFRAIPAVKFDDVASVEDPVRVRQAIVNGKRYYYVLNRLPVPLQLTLTLSGDGKVAEPATGKEFVLSKEQPLALKPYALLVFQSDNPDLNVTGGTIKPGPWMKTIEANLNDVTSTINSTQADVIAPFKPYYQKALDCLKNGQYARLHFLLQEGWVKDIERAANP
ncbi:hypothetical protein GCM10028807_18350 [Spirosoma daeguense]